MKLRVSYLWLLAVAFLVSACGNDMRDQSRYKPLEKSPFFEDGRSSRPLIEGTVSRGDLRDNEALYTGKEQGQYVKNLPVELTEGLLKRGQERFNIYCSVCHDRAGTGKGMIVQRGFKQPPALHEERLRNIPIGYLFEVMTNGFGVMSGYASQVNVRDRWAIAAYVRALQKSQSAPWDELSGDEQQKVLRSELS